MSDERMRYADAVEAKKLAESRAASCIHLPGPRLRDLVIGQPVPMRGVCISCVAELIEQLRAATRLLVELRTTDSAPEASGAGEGGKETCEPQPPADVRERVWILDRVIHDMRMHEGLRPRLDDLESARGEFIAALRAVQGET